MGLLGHIADDDEYSVHECSYQERIAELELNLERMETAIRMSLQTLSALDNGGSVVGLFQHTYRQNIVGLREAKETTVFALRKNTPTLTGQGK